MFNDEEIHEYIQKGLARLVELSQSDEEAIAVEASSNLVGLLLEYRKQQEIIDIMELEDEGDHGEEA